jgi:hypothetical protein
MGDMLITPAANQGFTDDALFKTIYGDVNFDSRIDLSDLSILSLSLIDDTTLTRKQKETADCNGDGTVNIADLARLRQFISKEAVILGDDVS